MRPSQTGGRSPHAPQLTLSWLSPVIDGRWMDSPHQATRELTTILSGHDSAGAILTGEVGDRRETLETALADIATDRAVYRLHGSPFAAASPYGSLSILLASLDVVPPTQFHGMVSALAEFLCPPGGRPAIVIVSHANQMDPGSIMVLAQLAQIDRITLVVHCDQSTEVPVDLTALQRSGKLVGITVLPLTPAASQRLVEDVVGGAVSRFAVTVLWRHSGGSISRLRQLALDCVKAGKLLRAGSCWILSSGPLPRHISVGLSATALSDVAVRQRALLEMLTVCGPMRVGDLIHSGYARELDLLHEDGAIVVRSDHSGRFAHITAVQEAETLAAIEPDRRRELATALEALDPSRFSVLRAANDLVAMGDVLGAVSVTAGAGERSSFRPGTAGVQGLANLAWAESQARAMLGDLDGAEAAVQNSPEGASASRSVLAASVAVARGDISEAHARLDRLPGDHHPELLAPGGFGFTREEIRCRAQAARAEALALGGDQAGALDLLGRLDHELSSYRTQGIADDVISPVQRALLAESMLSVLLTCGQLKRCREVAEAMIGDRHGSPHAIQYADLVLAALDALAGFRDRAAQRASHAAAQLEVVGNAHDLQLAWAIEQFCNTVAGAAVDVESSRLLADPLDGPSGRNMDQSLGRLGWLSELFLAMAAGNLHSAEARTERTLALADRAEAGGLYTVELLALASAFQCGEFWLAHRLIESAERTETANSQAHLLLVRSVLEDDQQLLVTALEELAAACGAGLLELVGSPLLKDLTPQTLRRITDSAAVAAGQKAGGGDLEQDSAPSWMVELTRREREISRLVVAGKKNANIARISGISIRTVEWHLSQIYTKLQLSGRDDLTRLALRHAASQQPS